MTEGTDTLSLSLYQIEAELIQLMRFREDVQQDTDITPQEQQASLDAIDKQITEYVHREVVKVDGIAAYLRECEARAAVLKAEAARIKAQADAWAARGERLEAVTLRVMQQTGATLLEGSNSTFKVKKNPPGVDPNIQMDIVPPAYLRSTLTLNRDLWSRLLSHLFGTEKGCALFSELQQCKITDPEPMKDAIKSELKQACPKCHGTKHLIVGVPGDPHKTLDCDACGGSGRNSVPGCRLVDDKYRLVVE
jgi:hypothetical protein